MVPPQVPALPPPSLTVNSDSVRPSDALLDRGTAYSVCHDLVARACSLHGRRWVQLQVEPHVQYSNHQEFSLDVDADHPDRASTSTKAIARLDRPTGAVEVRVHSQTMLRALSIKAEIDLDGSLFWERSWQKRW